MLLCLFKRYKASFLLIIIVTLLKTASGSGLDVTRCPAELKQELKKSNPKQSSLFYEEYLATYLPKALVIRGYFLANMDPQGINQAIEDIVTLLKTDPAFYFTNETDRVKIGFYWEAIVDQISLISEFLKKAYVDIATKKVFLLEPLMVGIGSSQINCSFIRNAKKPLAPMKQLLVFMKENRLESTGKFYATYFDFLVKLFNEGILFKDLPAAQRYLHELNFVMTKLRGTPFDRQYQEPLNTCKDLLALLQAHIATLDEDNGQDDEKEDNEQKRTSSLK